MSGGQKIKGKGAEIGQKDKKFDIEGEIDLMRYTEWKGWSQDKDGMPMNMYFNKFELNSNAGTF